MITCTFTRRRRKHLAFIGAALLFLGFVFAFYSHSGFQNYPSLLTENDLSKRERNSLAGQHAVFWRSLSEHILNNNPQCNKKPDLVVPQTMRIPYDLDYRRSRPDVLWLDRSDIERMKAAHANFISDLRAMSSGLVYKSGTRGIVVTVSESLFNVLAVSLHMLRKTSSDLPVEIFLDKPTFHAEAYCVRVFLPLGAKCRYYSDVFELANTKVKLNTFQYKVFSILFSSFERVLFLDSDAWPLTDPEALFHSLPFTETGLIFWPDFWYMSESPYFFEIARIASIPDLDERPATETSIMLYDKTKHARSLMLAAYYNYYGPEYYYLLQSQGGEGQGDKETFVWAATALDEPYYFVHEPVRSLGHHNSKGEYIGTAMVQSDPIVDFFGPQTSFDRRQVKTQAQRVFYNTDHDNHSGLPLAIPKDAQPEPKPAATRYKSKPLFIHANVPKLDPTTVFNDNIKGVHSPTRDLNGSYVRCWAPEQDSLKIFGFDVEKRFWTAMEEVACRDLSRLIGIASVGSKKLTKSTTATICESVRMYIREVF